MCLILMLSSFKCLAPLVINRKVKVKVIKIFLRKMIHVYATVILSSYTCASHLLHQPNLWLNCAFARSHACRAGARARVSSGASTNRGD
jgi:hypothetical protein